MVLEKKIFKSRQYIFTILLSSTIGDKNVKKLQTDKERDGRMTVDQKSSFKFPAHVSKNELVLNIYIYMLLHCHSMLKSARVSYLQQFVRSIRPDPKLG